MVFVKILNASAHCAEKKLNIGALNLTFGTKVADMRKKLV